ncbi:MAG: hypothetical protein V3T83_10735, partial [Acidobacteriota bacterium]
MQEPQISDQQPTLRGRVGGQPPVRAKAFDPGLAIEKANHLATQERFIYRGSAVAVAARFEEPREFWIPAQAASCLPGGGGLAEGLVEDFDEPGLVSFSRASSRAEGLEFKNETKRRFRTTVQASIEGLNIAGRLKAERLEASLVSRAGREADQPSIVPGDMPSQQSFLLDGHEIRVEFALDIFTQLGTLNKLRRAYAENDEFFEEYGHLFFNHKAPKRKKGFAGWLKKKLRQKNRKLPESRGYVLCGIVRRIVSSHPQAKVYGNVVELAGFGRLTLGEMIIDQDTRRLALMRFQLDPGIGTNGESEVGAQLLSDEVAALEHGGGTKAEGEV